MKKREATGRLEALLFLSGGMVLLLASVAAAFLAHSLHPANPRLLYGLHQLPAALLSIALFSALLALVCRVAPRLRGLAERPTREHIAVIAAAFLLFWLPVYLAGGFAQDDWQLLAAAAVRRVIVLHPTYAWRALDTVDGNFRPLGTVLYFGYLFRWFGAAAHAFTAGPFLLILLSSLVAFAIVRELGYTRTAASAAALLFLSRGMLYTDVAWASALGDSIAILFCGLASLFLLKAIHRRGPAAIAYHAAAWLCFVIAMLGKQSAFVMPLVAALLLYLRPGNVPLQNTRLRRTTTAILALCLYGTTAAAIFLHAKSLLQATSPYPVRFSFGSLLQSFAFAAWYFLVLQFPDRWGSANLLPSVVGIIVVAAFLYRGYRARKNLGKLGERSRDTLFAVLAGVASVSLFVVLATRSAPYYGCMAAFWFSIALALVLTQPGLPALGTSPTRRNRFLFCLLLLTGFAEVRLEQTGLVPSGGYLWGTYGMDTERSIATSVTTAVPAASDANTIVLTACPRAMPYAPMVILNAAGNPASRIRRILVFDASQNAWLANDHKGLLPVDGIAGLADPGSYNWTERLTPAEASGLISGTRTVELRCRNGLLEPPAL